VTGPTGNVRQFLSIQQGHPKWAVARVWFGDRTLN
jgi:hypothetical protein